MSTRTAVEEICGVDIRKIWMESWNMFPSRYELINKLLKLKPTNMNNNPTQKIKRDKFKSIFFSLPMSERIFVDNILKHEDYIFSDEVEFNDAQVKRMFKDWKLAEHQDFLNQHFINVPEIDLFDMRQYHSGMSHSLRPHFGDTDAPSGKAMIELVQSGAFLNKGYFLNRDFKWEIRNGEYNDSQILVPVEKRED